MDRQPLQAGLEAVATHVQERRDAILHAWRLAVERDPDLRTAVTMSRVQFYDHIPYLLDALVAALQANDLADARHARRRESDNAEGHGVQRWRQGYDEQQVMREWVMLNACLSDELHAFMTTQPRLAQEIVSEAWRRVSDFIVAGIGESAAQFARLQQVEATSRLRALEDAFAQFRELSRNRAELWREAAHDLRGNVSIVENVSHVLLSQGPRGKWLEMLSHGVASLNTLLNDLTLQARLDAGHEQREVRRFDAAAALRQLCSQAQPVASERGLYLEVNGPETLSVEGDQVKVLRIAQNLLFNALKYTSSGGVVVGYEAAGADAKRWWLSIADTGPGLLAGPMSDALGAATHLGQEIEAAARDDGHPSGEGTEVPTLPRQSSGPKSDGEGIGLAIVKRLCELLDATLEMQTGEGQGTTFRVTFPSHYRASSIAGATAS